MAALVGAVVCVGAAPAWGEPPGANGKLAFVSSFDGDWEIYTVNPDGTGKTQLTNNTTDERSPAWSPDGSKLAFTCCYESGGEVWVMSSTGANPVQLTQGTGYVPGFGRNVTWSPDGTKIAYTRLVCTPGCEDYTMELWTANADGTGATQILTGGDIVDVSWSSDGTKIVVGFDYGHGSDRLATVHPDGTNLTFRTNNCNDYAPDWSPDGTKIVFEGENRLFTIYADGTGRSALCLMSSLNGESPVWSPDGRKIAFIHRGNPWELHVADPDLTHEQNVIELGPPPPAMGPPWGLSWQPIPLTYIRPKAAAPTRVSLVPAYTQCTPPAANRTHGPPLGFPSCASPAQTSGQLTVGTPDANGQTAKSSGLVRYGVQIGNPATPADEANVRIIAQVTDVRKASDLSDYTGELGLDQGLRITDRDNTPNPGGPGPGTVTDTSFPVTIPCAATADASVGSTCAIDTTADALVPNTVKEGRRSVWQIGQVKVYDGGADGDAETTADNTLFMTQGVFVP